MKIGVALVLCGIIGALSAWLLGYLVIPWLHKLKFGQTILDIGPAWHKKKQGTPTMGGILFMAGTVIAMLVVVITDMALGGDIIAKGEFPSDTVKIKVYAGLLMAIAYSLIGLADDYIKVVKKRNLGLTIKQKSIAQVLVIGVYLGTLYYAGARHMYLPFIGSVEMNPIVFTVFGAITMYCTVNAVNFTDGIDGLCSSVTVTALASLTAIAFLRSYDGVSLMTVALLGALIGYLRWNWNPAKVIMGDLGSHFLGGMIVAISYALDVPWVILLIGLTYVMEFLSDVIQIGYFKMTHGKRIFKMAPIHHHFEMCGWKEKKIVYIFSLINLLGGLAAVALFYFDSSLK
ncbi:MAG: phospho-N-acetylmuramoyl-pentapeptide-transferase [Oscillospiraceae bacterium]|jgi:phospho-N-acetylmuramoyl-pentapeptide-transferase|nr:phospho-N-acetylmuramoyl-pentapeptide-transferase [Oscillospiraceae bacterium]